MEFVTPPQDPTINVLLYGPPKTGKSIGAGTSPKGVLYLNADLPTATRQVHLRNSDGSIFEPLMPEEGEQKLMPLLAEITRAVHDPNQDVIKTVVIDPLGELYRRLLEDFSRRAVRPSLPLYGDAAVQTERFVRKMLKAPVNCIIVAHEWGYEEADSEGMVKGIWTGTKSGSISMGNKVMGLVDIIGYTALIRNDAGEKLSVAQLFPGKGRQGGDRFDCLGAIRPLNISEWIEAIKANESGRPVPVPPELSTLTPEQVPEVPAEVREAVEAAEDPQEESPSGDEPTEPSSSESIGRSEPESAPKPDERESLRTAAASAGAKVEAKNQGKRAVAGNVGSGPGS